MNAPIPLPRPTRPEPTWSAAVDRVERSLQAHRLVGADRISRLAADIVAIARARQRPGVDPVTMAMETLEAGMAVWFGRFLAPEEREGAPSALVRGRLALAMGKLPERWPEYFLKDRAMPAELLRVMREADFGRGPEVSFSHMAPKAPAGPVPVAPPKWQMSYRWPFLRMLTGLVMVLSLIGAAALAAVAM